MIGDLNEGVAVDTFDSFKVEGPTDQPELRKRLEQVGVLKLGEGHPNVQIDSGTVMRRVDCFVFCMSSSEDFERAHQHLSREYDACLRMNDLKLIASLIDNGEVGGEPLGNTFWPVQIGRVQYESNTSNLNDSDSSGAATPFRKPLRFAGQQEIRFVLWPRAKVERDHLIVSAALPVGLLERLPDSKVEGIVDGTQQEVVAAPSVLIDGFELLLTDLLKLQDASSRSPNFHEKDWQKRMMDSYRANELAMNAFFSKHEEEFLRFYWGLREQGFASANLDSFFTTPFGGQSVLAFSHDATTWVEAVRKRIGG